MHMQTSFMKTKGWSCFWIKDPTMLLRGVKVFIIIIIIKYSVPVLNIWGEK